MKIKLILYVLLLVITQTVIAQDTISSKAKPSLDDDYKIRTSINLDLFGTKERNLIANSAKLKKVKYSFSEFSLGFYTPLYSYTSSKIADNKLYKSNFTLFATASFVTSSPDFSFYRTDKSFTRISAGLRAWYFNGNKSLWMLNVSPFIAEDNISIKHPQWRMYGDLVYSRVVSKKFSYRLGASYTFRFGKGGFVPVLGVRIGDYDKHFLSIQLPRNISYNVKISPKTYLGAFVRVNGGIYRFSIKSPDQTVFQDNLDNQNIIMTRTDYLSGISINTAASPNLYLCFNAGIVSGRTVDLRMNEKFNGNGGASVFKGKGTTLNIENSIFLNVSLTYSFGKPTYQSAFSPMLEMKALNNNYDAGDLNNSNDATTNDMNKVSSDDINKKEARSNLEDNYKDIQEYLMEE